ncbi:MAG TPA: NAD-dependent epimerase/dehydratase family protein [Planctomycetota bacterium]|nr:NAD-dependent epimerase/dehydratase family protein [Planctomycetota bacterium]
MQRWRAGLVGAGYISEYHIAALRRLKDVEIAGITDVDPVRAAATAEKFKLRVCPNMAALREAGANVIHVLTPPHTHADVTLQALELGCHVLVEKPLAVDSADCDRIEQKAAEKNLRVCVNHSLLHDPQVKRALNLVKSGKLGRIVSMDILRSSNYPPYAGGPLPPQYRNAGYPFRDLGVHALYLFEAFLGPIENVQADWKSLGGEPNLAYDEWRAQVRCRDGLGQFQLSWNTRPLQSQIILHGTRGVLRVDLFLMFHALRASTPLPKAAERVINAFTDSFQPMIDVPKGVLGYLRKKVLPYHGLQDLVATFYSSLNSCGSVPVSVADAKRVVEWTERIGRAADLDYERSISVLKTTDEVPYLVTGASGGLGGAIVKRLTEGGSRIRVLMRRMPENVPPNVEVVLGDLGDPVAVDKAVRGARTVIHAGAAMKGGWIEHTCGTIRGTENVLESCLKHKVLQLVHISSLSVVDWANSSNDAAISERTPYEPRAEERGAYTRAKLEAEQLVVRFARERGLPTVILRPGQIFGGKIPLLTPAVARRMGKRWLILGNGKIRLPLVYIDDVVDAVELAIKKNLHQGEIIQLVDREALTQLEVLELAERGKPKTLRLPRWLVFTLGWCSQVGLEILGRKSPLNVYRLKSALAMRSFSSVRADMLGWEPRVGVREGIRRVTQVVSVEKRSASKTVQLQTEVPAATTNTQPAASAGN